MAPAKRASTVSSDAAAKRRKCNVVEQAIADVGGYSASVKNLLSGAVSDCLGIYKDERHEFQKSIITMIGNVMASAEADLEKTIKNAEAKAGDLEAAQNSLTEASAQAASELDAKIEAEKAGQNAYNDSDTALKALLKTVDEKVSFDAFSIKFGESSANGQAGHGKDMAKLGKELGFADILLDAISSGFKKAPESRSTFEKYSIDELGKAMTKNISELSKTDSSEEALSAARSKKEAMSSAVEEAKAAHIRAKEAKDEADRAVTKALPALKKAKEALDGANMDLKSFQEKAKVAFNELVELEAPKPEPEKEATAASGHAGLDAA